MIKTLMYVGVSFVILLTCFATVPQATLLQENTCITCHTDDLILKKLFIPPKTQASEGEG